MGSADHGSESNSSSTGRLMQEVARIGAADWKDPSVGSAHLSGILGHEPVNLHWWRCGDDLSNPIKSGDQSVCESSTRHHQNKTSSHDAYR